MGSKKLLEKVIGAISSKNSLGGNLKANPLNKQLVNYITQDPNKDLLDEGQMDLTPKGIIQTINARFKLHDVENQNIISRAAEYEKQANFIESKLIQKLNDIENFITQKANSIRIMRLDNYQYQKKLRQNQ